MGDFDDDFIPLKRPVAELKRLLGKEVTEEDEEPPDKSEKRDWRAPRIREAEPAVCPECSGEIETDFCIGNYKTYRCKVCDLNIRYFPSAPEPIGTWRDEDDTEEEEEV